MLTIFTTPRPFVDPHIVSIQRNAIGSWLSLTPTPQVILIGDDEGVSDVAKEFSIQHIPDVEKDGHGIPMISSMFQIAHGVAERDFLCMINCDIVIMDDLCGAVLRIPLERFVAAGRRHDLNVTEDIDFHQSDWPIGLRERVRLEGTLRSHTSIDYVVFPQCLSPPSLPPFAMGSLGWDPWFLYDQFRRGVPIVDLTPVIGIVHQNHESVMQNRKRLNAWREDAEAMAKLRKVGGFESMMTLREAHYVMTGTGLRRPVANRILLRLLSNPIYRRVMGRRRANHRFDLGQHQ